MRIDSNLRASEAQVAEQGSASAKTSAAASNSAVLASDTAQFSGDQVRLQALAAQVNALPEIRQEKVAALGQAIRSGRYQVTPEQTAEAVLSEMLAGPIAA